MRGKKGAAILYRDEGCPCIVQKSFGGLNDFVLRVSFRQKFERVLCSTLCSQLLLLLFLCLGPFDIKIFMAQIRVPCLTFPPCHQVAPLDAFFKSSFFCTCTVVHLLITYLRQLFQLCTLYRVSQTPWLHQDLVRENFKLSDYGCDLICLFCKKQEVEFDV